LGREGLWVIRFGTQVSRLTGGKHFVNALVDGFLWIGRPGYSGGSCEGGPLPIGTWWREHALKLARRATSRLGP
jgi:cellulase/cellobiase CelA1